MTAPTGPDSHAGPDAAALAAHARALAQGFDPLRHDIRALWGEGDLATYERAGFGVRVGVGAQPAVVVVDMINGFTDPASPVGADMSVEIAAMRALIDAARAVAAPVVYVTIAFDAAGSDAAAPSLNGPGIRTLREGSAAVEVDRRLGFGPGDPLVVKKTASAFFGTNLQPLLTARGVDTVIVCGCTTSGCIRATANDANAHGFRTIVPIETTADRARGPHLAALHDIAAKIGDVGPLAGVLAALRG